MPKALLFLLLACLAPAAVFAQQSVYLEELTWTEVRDATKAGKTTIIVPVGGTEQNGPHMTLGKHNARVKLLAGRIATA
ncbi:MAG TPA: creatininase family protein, partial [Usitatibacter sp.]